MPTVRTGFESVNGTGWLGLCAAPPIVKRVLRKFGYAPDKREKATQTVLEQAEVLCRDWSGAAAYVLRMDIVPREHFPIDP